MNSIQIPHMKQELNIHHFRYESGQMLDKITVTYETWGRLNALKNNAVLIAHALTGTSHAANSSYKKDPGWWEFLIGPDKAIDTRKYFVICSNVLGGCSGTSGPSSINPLPGKPHGMNFPAVTIRDMVHAQKQLIDFLGVKKLVMITGASMGGMQALEWAANYPDLVESIIPISTPGRAYPQSIAYRKSQRRAIMMDSDWRGGNYYGISCPTRGIELARLIGFISYRTEREFAYRFGRRHHDTSIFDINARFEIESYLEYHGNKLAQWFDANTYIYLSKAMDLHDLGRGFKSYEQGVHRIQSKVLMFGLDSDILFPCYQKKEVIEIINKTNHQAEYKEVKSLYGHDAFLIEEEQVSKIILEFLEEIDSKTREITDEISDKDNSRRTQARFIDWSRHPANLSKDDLINDLEEALA